MATRHRQPLPLLLALLVSLLLHAAVLLPSLLLAMQLRAGDQPRLEARFQPRQVDQPRPQPPEIDVGIEQSDASTLNWIGYETYEKHLALLSETDQPALGTEVDGPMVESEPQAASPPAALSVPPSMQEPAPAAAVEPAAVALKSDAPAAPEAPAPPTELPKPGTSPPPPSAGLELPRWFGALTPLGLSSASAAPGLSPENEDAPPLEDAQPGDRPSIEHPPPPAPHASDHPPLQDHPDLPKPIEARPARAAPETAPRLAATESPPSPPTPELSPSPAQSDPSLPAPPPQSPARGRAAPADKEADPTAVIDVPRDQWQLGKPLSARGLELKPRRPNFTLLTLVTAAPCNPICRIEFGADGVPVRAALLKTSCDRRTDEAIESSLYGWRAIGKPLGELNHKQTIPVTVRIILIKPPD